MNKLLLLIFALLAILAVIESTKVEIIELHATAIDSKWSEFKKKFTKKYKNQTHKSIKRTAFEKNLEIINQNNEKST